MLLAWIEGGMARGNPEEDPEAREWPKDWRIGRPDKISKMRKSFQVPAEGVVEYQYFSVETKFKKDKSRPFAMNPVTRLIPDDQEFRMLAAYVWSLSQH